MKGFSKVLFLVFAAVLSLTGCNRHPKSGASFDADGTRIQPGAPGAESDDSGYLALQIGKIYENQKPLEQAPWHADGGDWTFFDCNLSKQPPANIVVGVHTRILDKNAGALNVPINWGEARLAVDDSAGAQFIDAFAKAFHTESPPTRSNHPAGLLKMQTAVLGSSLTHHAGGGFKDGHGGTWAASKWFLEEEGVEAEVYFNFSLADKRVEFSEKDADYREDLVQQFAIAFRDGPLPERTPENDPTMTLVGPTVVNWTLIGGSNETCQFSPDSTTLAITAGRLGSTSKIFIASTAEATNRKLLGEFESSTSVEQFLSTPNGLVLFVGETHHKNPNMISTADPITYWLLDAQGKHPINLPVSGTNWIAWKNCVSPDANFIALNSWVNEPGKQRSRVIHLGNLHSGEWKTIQLPGTVIGVVGWEAGRGIVLTGLDYDKKSIRKPYSLDPATGQLTPLDSIPPQFNPAAELSPNGRQSVEVIEKDRLIFADVATGTKREFVFQPVDRSNVYHDSVHWANDRYLIFGGDRTALIDSQKLKMNFLASKKAGFNSADFSPDFKLAIGIKADSHYLGTVKLPE